MYLLDLSNDNCIKKIVLKKQTTCAKSNVHHTPRVEEIVDGIILLNDVSKTVLTETITINSYGAFIVKFDNTIIKIDDKIYQNLDHEHAAPPFYKRIFI